MLEILGEKTDFKEFSSTDLLTETLGADSGGMGQTRPDCYSRRGMLVGRGVPLKQKEK